MMNKPKPQLAKEQKQRRENIAKNAKKIPLGFYKGRLLYDESEIIAMKANCEQEIKTLRLIKS